MTCWMVCYGGGMRTDTLVRRIVLRSRESASVIASKPCAKRRSRDDILAHLLLLRCGVV